MKYDVTEKLYVIPEGITKEASKGILAQIVALCHGKYLLKLEKGEPIWYSEKELDEKAFKIEQK